jgi:hypothetical protein
MSKINLKRSKHRKVMISILLLSILTVVMLSVPSISSLSAQQTTKTIDNESTEAKPFFNLEVGYAYVGKGPNDTCVDPNGCIVTPKSQYPSAVYFNVTRSVNAEPLQCDAMIEIYTVNITSDKGPSENFAYFDGTNYKPLFSDEELTKLTSHIYDVIDTNTVNSVSGNFCFNWTSGDAIMSKKVGSIGSYNNYDNGLGLWSAGQPNAISVTVHRLGYVTMTNGAISVHTDKVASDTLTQVELQKFGDSFLNNRIMATDKLSQSDLFHPID